MISPSHLNLKSHMRKDTNMNRDWEQRHCNMLNDELKGKPCQTVYKFLLRNKVLPPYLSQSTTVESISVITSTNCTQTSVCSQCQLVLNDRNTLYKTKQTELNDLITEITKAKLWQQRRTLIK